MFSRRSSASAGAAVAVAGGGPAGSAAAIKLAALDHEVLLIEAAAFPRPHVGESLSPGVAAAAAALGIGELLSQAGAARFDQSELSWRSSGWEPRPVHRESATVDRGRFDALLRDAAAARGVEVKQPARVRSAVRAGEGWRLVVDERGSERCIAARFLIDATGRSGLLGRRRRTRGPLLYAMSADWHGAGIDRPRVKAGPNYWLWGSPIPGRGYSLILFTGIEEARRHGGDFAGFYARTVRAAKIVAVEATPGTVRLMDATGYCNADISGEAHLRVGEAAFAIDPLSSSGVHKAMASGIVAAIAANTILRRPGDAALARGFYEDSQLHAHGRHARWTASVYADHLAYAGEGFWRERATNAAAVPAPAARKPGPIALSPDARLAPVACLSDEFVERRPGVTHPALDRPIVYAGGREIATLLDGDAGNLEARFHCAFPRGEAQRQLSRLLDLGVLV